MVDVGHEDADEDKEEDEDEDEDLMEICDVPVVLPW